MTTDEMFIGAIDAKLSMWCRKVVRDAEAESKRIFNPNRRVKLYEKREKALKVAERKVRKYGKSKVTCKYNPMVESWVVEWFVK